MKSFNTSSSKLAPKKASMGSVNYSQECKTLTNQNSIQEELTADGSQGMLATIWCRIFRFPVCYPEI